MRPDTVDRFTFLALSDVQKSVESFEHFDASTLDADGLRCFVVTCKDIVYTFEALKDLLITTAKELDAADQNAEGAIYHPRRSAPTSPTM